MSMGKQNVDFFFFFFILFFIWVSYLVSRSKFHSVTSSNVILYNGVKNSIFIKRGFGFGTELYFLQKGMLMPALFNPKKTGLFW